MREFKELLRKKVSSLFLILWPPWGEEKESDIDISFGFIFEDERNKLYVISVDKDDLWRPHVFYESLPQYEYTWEDFYPRVAKWMRAEDNDCIIDKEYYDVSKCILFEKIINCEIIAIELLYIENNAEPFGVKILFENDYIISTPNSDGNTVETQTFNKIDIIKNFKHLGNVIYSEI